MAWRCVHLSHPARLKLKDQQILIVQEEESLALPLEDVACLVLDTMQVTLSGALLSAFATQGIALIVPDEKHHPAGTLLPFHQHHAQAELINLQIAASHPLRKRLWQMLVIAKINNQAALLAENLPAAAASLQSLSQRVTSGDRDNIEAQAARFYWQRLFANFTRSNGTDKRNGLLNYGYAILRAAIARACVAAGFVPALGLHHASRTNPFNLVDDLIEPFRPWVDQMVQQRQPTYDRTASTLEDRRFMAGILSKNVLIDQEYVTILTAINMMTTHLVRALTHNNASLLRLPSLPSGRHV